MVTNQENISDKKCHIQQEIIEIINTYVFMILEYGV